MTMLKIRPDGMMFEIDAAAQNGWYQVLVILSCRLFQEVPHGNVAPPRGGY